MQRRDSLGLTTKIPRLSNVSTRNFKTRRSQSSFSSASDVFAETESTKGQLDLSVSEMRLRSEKNLDGDQRRSAEAGTASETLVDPFDEGEQTLIRLDFEPSEDLEREEVERTEETSERSEIEPREEVLFKGMPKSETKSHRWRGEYSHSASTHSSLAKQSNNAMMSSISPSEEQPGSKAKKSWKSLYDEHMASLPTVGLTSNYDYPEIAHPDVNFTPDNTDQCLAESLAQANKESYEREARMTREIERLLNDHDSTYAHTMTSLEKRLDAKSDLMMRKLDAILNGSNWQERSNPRERSRHANDGNGTGSNARAQQGSRTNYEPRNKERPSEAPSRPGWTNPVPPEADATPETRLPTVPQVSSVPDLTTVSQDTTMYASMFEPLNRSLETFITKLSKSTERGERSRRTLKKPKS